MKSIVSKKLFKPVVIVSALSSVFFLSTAQAATVTGVINAQIIIGPGCEVNNLPHPLATPLSFGSLDFGSWTSLANPGSPNIDASTSDSANGGVTVECNTSITYTIALDNGLHHSGSTRRMQNTSLNTAYVDYGVFQDAARTTPWVGNSPLSVTNTGTSNTPQTTTHHFYGRVAPQNQANAGTYTDTLNVVIEW